jgi:hypothetical protein
MCSLEGYNSIAHFVSVHLVARIRNSLKEKLKCKAEEAFILKMEDGLMEVSTSEKRAQPAFMGLGNCPTPALVILSVGLCCLLFLLFHC